MLWCVALAHDIYTLVPIKNIKLKKDNTLLIPRGGVWCYSSNSRTPFPSIILMSVCSTGTPVQLSSASVGRAHTSARQYVCQEVKDSWHSLSLLTTHPVLFTACPFHAAFATTTVITLYLHGVSHRSRPKVSSQRFCNTTTIRRQNRTNAKQLRASPPTTVMLVRWGLSWAV